MRISVFESYDSSIDNEFNFLSFYGIFSLRLKSTPGTAEGLFVNLARTCLIQTEPFLFPKKFSAYFLALQSSTLILSAQYARNELFY